MNHSTRLLSLLLFVTISVVASGDDRQKAEKQVRKITAMAIDKTGRRMVSMTIADSLKVPRSDMVEERRKIGLDYGSFFVAHQLISNGVKMTDVTLGLRAGKTVWQIGDEYHANWKRIAGNAKKMNAEIDLSIYRHFLGEKHAEANEARDLADKYDLAHDGVESDSSVSQQEIVEAQERYVFWRDQAGQISDRRLGLSKEMAARVDAHGGGPKGSAGSSSVGTTPPTIGGVPPN